MIYGKASWIEGTQLIRPERKVTIVDALSINSTSQSVDVGECCYSLPTVTNTVYGDVVVRPNVHQGDAS